MAFLKVQSWTRQISADSEASDVKPSARRRFQRFKAAVYAINVLRRLCPPKGIRMEHVLQKHRDGYDDRFSALEEDEQEFASSILTLPSMFWKSTKLLMLFQDQLSRCDCPSREIREEFEMLAWDGIVQVMSKLKLFVAKNCWNLHIKAGQRELKELKLRYEALQERFKVTRTAYLQEVAALRDLQRQRLDPEALILGQQHDIVSFYDPTASLEPAELSFVCKVISEKLKMIFESNKGMPGFNMAQVQKLLEAKDTNEVAEMKAALKRQANVEKELRTIISEMQRSTIAAAASRRQDQQSSGQMSAAAEGMIRDLEEQVDILRKRLKDSADAEAVLSERDQLQLSLNAETAERARLQHLSDDIQAKLTNALAELSELQAAKVNVTTNSPSTSESTKQISDLERKLAASRNEVQEMRKQMDRLKDILAKQRARQEEEELLQDEEIELTAKDRSLRRTPRSKPAGQTPAMKTLVVAAEFLTRSNSRKPTFGAHSLRPDPDDETTAGDEDVPSSSRSRKPEHKSTGTAGEILLQVLNEELKSEVDELQKKIKLLQHDQARKSAEDALAQAMRTAFEAASGSFNGIVGMPSDENVEGKLEATRQRCLDSVKELQTALKGETDHETWLQRVEEARKEVMNANLELRNAETRAAIMKLSQGNDIRKDADSTPNSNELDNMRDVLRNINDECRDLCNRLEDSEAENERLLAALNLFKDKADTTVKCIRSSPSFRVVKEDLKVMASIRSVEELSSNPVYKRLSAGMQQSKRFAESRQRYIEESTKALMMCLKLDPHAKEHLDQEPALALRQFTDVGSLLSPSNSTNVLHVQPVTSTSSAEVSEPEKPPQPLVLHIPTGPRTAKPRKSEWRTMHAQDVVVGRIGTEPLELVVNKEKQCWARPTSKEPSPGRASRTSTSSEDSVDLNADISLPQLRMPGLRRNNDGRNSLLTPDYMPEDDHFLSVNAASRSHRPNQARRDPNKFSRQISAPDPTSHIKPSFEIHKPSEMRSPAQPRTTSQNMARLPAVFLSPRPTSSQDAKEHLVIHPCSKKG